MSKFQLTHAQKDEIRQLTQRANRRIKGLQAQYEREGINVLPHEFAKDKQLRSQWETQGSPLSRGVKFGSEREYQKRLNYLKSFDNTATNYSREQSARTFNTVKDNVGHMSETIIKKVQKKLSKMNAAQLSGFWKEFEERSRRMGADFDSEQVLAELIAEYAEVELEHILGLE